MKKAVNMLLAITLFMTSLLVAGCLPPNYTKEKAQKIAKEHAPEAVEWFKQHKPAAKVDSSVEAYATGIDLLGAVKGEYKLEGKSYKYVYDYQAKKMYVGEGYKQACKLVEADILKELGYARANTEFNFHGFTFAAGNENDSTRGGYAEDQKKEKFLKSYQEELLPADLTSRAFADEALKANSGVNFPFFVDTYNENFPEYKPEVFKAHSNLGGIIGYIPIDCEKGFNGVYRKRYTKDKIIERVCHIEKIYDGLYGGYFSTGEEVEDKLIITRKDSKNFSMEIPANTKPVFFSKSSINLLHSFKNPAGNIIKNEANEVYKTVCPGNKGCNLFSVDFMVKNNVPYCYDSMRVSYVQGKYDFKVLGIFDWEYWKLLLF